MSSRYLHEVNTQDGIKYFVIEPDYEMPIEVYYVVRYWTEYQKTYIVDGKGYSNYFSSAKKFYNASDAFAIATKMTKNSKAGNIWKAVRVEDGVEME